jgi:uncharacterized protein YqgC (DUF456 family)
MYVAATLVTLVSLGGIGLTLITLPGIWVMIGFATLVHLVWVDLYSPWTLAAAVVLGVLAEVAELVASAAGSARAGGSKHGAIWSILGAIVGAIAGSFVVPIIGSIVGGVVGAGLGAVAGELTFGKKHWKDAARVGQGAAVGRFFSTIIKAGFATTIALVLSIAAFV